MSASGIHWHVKLNIKVRGNKQTIPTDIGFGIGPGYRANPTFDTTMGELGDFFKVWRQPFTATELLGYRTGAGGHVSMTVNGKSNTSYDRYLIRDGDEIVIRYA